MKFEIAHDNILTQFIRRGFTRTGVLTEVDRHPNYICLYNEFHDSPPASSHSKKEFYLRYNPKFFLNSDMLRAIRNALASHRYKMKWFPTTGCTEQEIKNLGISLHMTKDVLTVYDHASRCEEFLIL